MSRLRLVLRAGLVTAAALVAAVTLVTSAAALSINTAAITFPEVILDGTNQTVYGSTSAWQADAAGENGGWKVTVASTDFSNADNKTIAVSNFKVRLLSDNITWVSGDPNKPASTQTDFASLSGTALKIASAADTGNGVYNMAPDFQLNVPAETYTGDYTATVTVAISAGP